jgi:hypothetical protein
MVLKYTKILHCKSLQNLPKIGIFGWKTNHLATLLKDKNGACVPNSCEKGHACERGSAQGEQVIFLKKSPKV